MVRKRKNSEESAATVPRLTRQRCNLDDEGDPVLEKSTKVLSTPKTPSNTRRNNRKRNVASGDSARATRSQIIQEQKSFSDSETENKIENLKQTLETPGGESYTTRSRTRKNGNNTKMRDSVIILAKENTTESQLALGGRRNTRKKQILTTADNTLVEGLSLMKSQNKLTRSQAKNLMCSPVQKRTSFTKSFETPKKVSTSSRKLHNPIVELAADTVTPESSPMLVNLTPHRSHKTPKKSPMNIGSPKTHSQSPLRLSKTPRKLTINVESPATSDKSSVSISNHSPIDHNLLAVQKSDPFIILTDFNKLASPITEIETSKNLLTTFVSVAELRLRKSGDNKSPSKTSEVDSELSIDEIWSQIADTNLEMKSPAKKPTVLASKIRKSPIKTAAAIRTPKKTPDNTNLSKVVNPESPKRLKSTVKKRSPMKSLGTPLTTIIQARQSLENKIKASPSISAPKKMSLLFDVGNLSPLATPQDRIGRSLHLTPDFSKLSTGSTSSPIVMSKQNSTSRLNFPKFKRSDQSVNRSIELVDGSNFMDVTDDISKKGDETYELSKDIENVEEIDDATYELNEPKTPSLKKQPRKRSLSKVEPGKCTPDAKKRCRVRFATPTGNKAPNSPSLNDRKSLPTVKTPAKPRVATRLSRGSVGVDSTRRRSRSLTKADGKTTSIKRRSTSVSDVTNKTPKLSQSIQNSINRLSKPRQLINSENKLETKLPVARSVPNFAQIHQKKFEKMESLVDAKKRVAKRHVELNTMPSTRASQSSISFTPLCIVPESTTIQISKNTAPVSMSAIGTASVTGTATSTVPDSTGNGVFTRFGFKLRKAEAMKVVSKKPPAVTRSKNHLENNRSILKGVRTNKRFELQMKMRNLKQ